MRIRTSPCFAKAIDGCGELSRKAPDQGLDVNRLRDKREFVRTRDEPGEAANARRSIQQDLWKYSGNTLRHVLREEGKRQSANARNAIVTQEPFENRGSILEIQVRRYGSEGARPDDRVHDIFLDDVHVPLRRAQITISRCS